MNANIVKRANDIQQVCAVGTGTMGVFTALCFALGGRDVKLYGMSRNPARLDNAMVGMDTALNVFHDHGFIRQSDIAATLSLITPTLSLPDAASQADLVMESIDEDLSIKQKFFSQVDAICPPHTLFATNTSSLDLDPIAASTRRTDKFLALHFFNAAHQNRVVEIAPAAGTSTETMDTAAMLMGAIGRAPVRLRKSAPLFIVNKVQINILRTAVGMVERGDASAYEIDAALEQATGRSEAGVKFFDMDRPYPLDRDVSSHARRIQKAARATTAALCRDGIATPQEISKALELTLGRRYTLAGPLRSADLGGWDIFEKIFRNDDAGVGAVPELVTRLVAAGHTGVKAQSRQGIYDWTDLAASQAIIDRRAHGMLAFLLSDWQHDYLQTQADPAAPHPIYRGAMESVAHRAKGLDAAPI